MQLPPSTERPLLQVDVLRQHARCADRRRHPDSGLPTRRDLRAPTQPPPHQRRCRRRRRRRRRRRDAPQVRQVAAAVDRRRHSSLSQRRL